MGKVIHLASKAKRKKEVESIAADAPATFEEIAKKNAANEERLAKERKADNKRTLRSYRIK